MSYNPISIANGFRERAEESGRPINPMQILKLVYIAHGWSLALADAPLIGDDVQAWQFGPVIPTLYQSVKKYGNGQITKKLHHPYFPSHNDDSAAIHDDDNGLLDKIHDVYGHLQAFQLSALTHKEGTPWDTVWNKEGGSMRRGSLIRQSLIAEHFRGLASRQGE